MTASVKPTQSQQESIIDFHSALRTATKKQQYVNRVSDGWIKAHRTPETEMLCIGVTVGKQIADCST